MRDELHKTAADNMERPGYLESESEIEPDDVCGTQLGLFRLDDLPRKYCVKFRLQHGRTKSAG